MRRTFLLVPLLTAGLVAQDDSAALYEKLMAEYASQTASYRNGKVTDLLPDTMPIHEVFLKMAQEREGEDSALPFLGWILQNAPRNDRVHGAAIAAIAKRAGDREVGDVDELFDKLDTNVVQLKYGTLTDAIFAETLLGLKAIAAISDAQKARVTPMIFQLERLQVGARVPDIVGADLDGVEFKLSDYRGKVVVIDFWGDW